MRRVAVLLLSIHLVGCCLVEKRTAEIQMSDEVVNDFASGANPESFFLVIGNRVVGPHSLRIEKVSAARKEYAKGPDEYLVSINLGHISCRDWDQIYLFNEDYAENEGVVHIEVQRKDYQVTNIDRHRFADVKWAILRKLVARYKSTREIPEDALEFMRIYDLFYWPYGISGTHGIGPDPAGRRQSPPLQP